MTRQDLGRLNEMLTSLGKETVKEFPEGLVGIRYDMMKWAKEQPDAPVKSSPKSKSTKKDKKDDEKGEPITL